MLAERGSPGFERFLEILGERIRLKGWDKYRGGLDVKGMLGDMDIDSANSTFVIKREFGIASSFSANTRN